MAAQVVSGQLEMPGHLEMTPDQSPMETGEPGARARRRADEAEIADRWTPPKRPPQPAGDEGHQEMTGHLLDIPQGGKKQLRQLSWREAYRGAEAARALAEPAAPAGGAAKSPRSRLAHPRTKADGTAGGTRRVGPRGTGANLGICRIFSQTRRRARPTVGRGGADRADRELETSSCASARSQSKPRVNLFFRWLSGRDRLLTPTASAPIKQLQDGWWSNVYQRR